MTLDELMAELHRVRTSDEIGAMCVMSNHPGSGFPWGDIKSVDVIKDKERYPDCVFLDMGME